MVQKSYSLLLMKATNGRFGSSLEPVLQAGISAAERSSNTHNKTERGRSFRMESLMVTTMTDRREDMPRLKIDDTRISGESKGRRAFESIMDSPGRRARPRPKMGKRTFVSIAAFACR